SSSFDSIVRRRSGRHHDGRGDRSAARRGSDANAERRSGARQVRGARVKRIAIGALVALGVAAGANVHAAPEPPAASSATGPTASLLLAGMPVFGPDASEGDGWTEVVARVENVSTAPIKGNVELVSAVPGHRGNEDNVFTAKAPFNVPAGKSAVVKLPTHAFG